MNDELFRRKQEAVLAEIIMDAQDCRANGGDCDSVIDRCQMLASQAAFIDLRDKANRVSEALMNDMLHEAIADLKKTLADLASPTAVMRDATVIARQGERDLLLPSLAITTTQMLDTMEQIQQAIASVKGGLDGVDKLRHVPAATKKVIDALQELKAGLEV